MTRSNAFLVCGICGGAGFMCVGPLVDRTFIRCAACGGCGQKYLDPIPPPPPAEPYPPFVVC